MSTVSNPAELFRPAVQALAEYVPGEQPREAGWLKLNTNENPYPPSPAVIDAITNAVRGPMEVYPDPIGRNVQEEVARLFQVDPEGVLCANGSDENLTILFRSFVDPGDLIVYPYPSYILYETIAGIQGATTKRLPLDRDWRFDPSTTRPLIEQAKLVLIPNPNSPAGNLWTREDILSLVPPNGILVLDEAYGDFPEDPHRAEILSEPEGERIVITRTLSKSYSLAGLRFGFSMSSPTLANGMRKVKDSYNCDRLALAGALAALRDQDTMRSQVAAIRQTRERLRNELQRLNFEVTPSEANFLWCRHPSVDHEHIYQELKARKILIRFMQFPGAFGEPERVYTGLRMTVGTEGQIDRLLSALREVLSSTEP